MSVSRCKGAGSEVGGGVLDLDVKRLPKCNGLVNAVLCLVDGRKFVEIGSADLLWNRDVSAFSPHSTERDLRKTGKFSSAIGSMGFDKWCESDLEFLKLHLCDELRLWCIVAGRSVERSTVASVWRYRITETGSMHIQEIRIRAISENSPFMT